MENWWELEEIPEDMNINTELRQFKNEMVAKGKELGRRPTHEDIALDEEEFKALDANLEDVSYEEFLQMNGYDEMWHFKMIDDLVEGKERKKKEIKDFHQVLKKYNNKYVGLDSLNLFAFNKWAGNNLNFEKYIEKYQKLKDEKDEGFAKNTVFNGMFFEFIRRAFIPKNIQGIQLNNEAYFDESKNTIRGKKR